MISSYILKTRIKTALLFITITSFSIYIVQKYFNRNIHADITNYPVILWWTPFMLETKKLINCEDQFQCILTKNRSYKNHANLAAYLFYGSNFDFNDLPLPKNNIPWAIFHEESPKNLPFFLNRNRQRLFNFTSTFSRNSDFPIPLQYLRDVDLITDRKYYVPLGEKNIRLKKIAPVLYVQSDCDTPSERDGLVSELMTYIKIDSYGACLNNKKLPEKYKIDTILEDLYEEQFMEFTAQYKFTIAIENSVCHDYITEKLWRPLIAGSIPIYLGSPTIKDWLPNNNSAILINDYKSIADLANYLHDVNTTDELYEKYMQHKLENKITNGLLKSVLRKGFYGIENNQEFPIPAFECFICKSVHQGLFFSSAGRKSVYDCEEPFSRDANKDNWWKMHWKIGQCQAKTLYCFLDTLKLRNFTKEMFSEEYMRYFNNNDC